MTLFNVWSKEDEYCKGRVKRTGSEEAEGETSRKGHQVNYNASAPVDQVQKEKPCKLLIKLGNWGTGNLNETKYG